MKEYTSIAEQSKEKTKKQIAISRRKFFKILGIGVLGVASTSCIQINTSRSSHPMDNYHPMNSNEHMYGRRR